jgi:hypothetical protein
MGVKQYVKATTDAPINKIADIAHCSIGTVIIIIVVVLIVLWIAADILI